MDGVAIALQASEEAEGEDANGEANKGDHDAHPSDDSKEQLMGISNIALKYKTNKKQLASRKKNSGKETESQLICFSSSPAHRNRKQCTINFVHAMFEKKQKQKQNRYITPKIFRVENFNINNRNMTWWPNMYKISVYFQSIFAPFWVNIANVSRYLLLLTY